MSWSMISFAGGFESPDCKWVRTIFQSLYEAASDAEFDDLALYVAKRSGNEATLYLSPRATARVTAAMSRYPLVRCERPATEDVELVTGPAFAWRTEWSEMTSLERREIEEDEEADSYHEAASLGLLGLDELRDGDEDFYPVRELAGA